MYKYSCKTIDFPKKTDRQTHRRNYKRIIPPQFLENASIYYFHIVLYTLAHDRHAANTRKVLNSVANVNSGPILSLPLNRRSIIGSGNGFGGLEKQDTRHRYAATFDGGGTRVVEGGGGRKTRSFR